MKILLIEDELNKEKSIIKFLEESFPEVCVVAKHSIMSAKLALKDGKFDYIFLDMTLPLYDNDDNDIHHRFNNEVNVFGGTEILEEMETFDYPGMVVLITAFDILGEGKQQKKLSDISLKLKKDYERNFVDTIYYNGFSTEWKEKLLFILKKEIKNENTYNR